MVIRMSDTLGKCQCINIINRAIILNALSKEDTMLYLKINELRENRDKLDSQLVDTQIPVLQRLKDRVGEVIVKVKDTPICK